jgi:hypothetical protein
MVQPDPRLIHPRRLRSFGKMQQAVAPPSIFYAASDLLDDGLIRRIGLWLKVQRSEGG